MINETQVQSSYMHSREKIQVILNYYYISSFCCYVFEHVHYYCFLRLQEACKQASIALTWFSLVFSIDR